MTSFLFKVKKAKGKVAFLVALDKLSNCNLISKKNLLPVDIDEHNYLFLVGIT